jgi:hypothetical protein
LKSLHCPFHIIVVAIENIILKQAEALADHLEFFSLDLFMALAFASSFKCNRLYPAIIFLLLLPLF